MREATEVGTTNLGAPGLTSAPCWVVPPRGSPQVLFWPIGFLPVRKKSTKSFAVFPGAPRWVVPTSVASRTPSLPYKFTNILKTLGVNLDQKFCRRKAL